jgi:release factor glutamine methyltransferase
MATMRTMMPQALPPAEACTVAALHAWGRAQLAGDEARRESELLLGHALQRERAWLFAHAGDAVEETGRARFAALVAARARGVPVAQLLGRWGFWTLELRVTPDTLIPRPETELLVEAALARLPAGGAARVADLGTGSGAIALALAHSRPDARIVATDASAAALAVARENAAANELRNVELRLGDWYAPLAAERFDLLVSNPPYIAQDDPHLAQGDLRFEPLAALASGVDGLDAIRVLAAGACRHLRAGGWLLVEHGFAQGAAVRAVFAGAGLTAVETLRDLEGRERVTLGQCAAPPGLPAADGASA